MDIPDLIPDLTFPRLRETAGDIDFAFEAKRAALGPYIIPRWGWDDVYQRDVHNRRFRETPFSEIRRGVERLGTVSFQRLDDHLRFGEFYLFPRFQRKGAGTRVLGHCLALADRIRLPVRLEHLLWNPVGALYIRHGFIEIGRSDIHCHMERPPGVSPRD